MKTNPSLKVFKPSKLGLAIVIAWGLSVQLAQANPYVETLQQVGSNVVATGSGAIDLTGLSVVSNNGGATASAVLIPNHALIYTGPPGVVDVYQGFSGPTSFGSGSTAFASTGSGDLVGIGGAANFLIVPHVYVSGTALSDSSTYDSATFSSLGVTPGTYEWTWGTGPDQKFTLQIGPAAVPDSGSTFGLLFFLP